MEEVKKSSPRKEKDIEKMPYQLEINMLVDNGIRVQKDEGEFRKLELY